MPIAGWKSKGFAQREQEGCPDLNASATIPGEVEKKPVERKCARDTTSALLNATAAAVIKSTLLTTRTGESVHMQFMYFFKVANIQISKNLELVLHKIFFAFVKIPSQVSVYQGMWVPLSWIGWQKWRKESKPNFYFKPWGGWLWSRGGPGLRKRLWGIWLWRVSDKVINWDVLDT